MGNTLSPTPCRDEAHTASIRKAVSLIIPKDNKNSKSTKFKERRKEKCKILLKTPAPLRKTESKKHELKNNIQRRLAK